MSRDESVGDDPRRLVGNYRDTFLRSVLATNYVHAEVIGQEQLPGMPYVPTDGAALTLLTALWAHSRPNGTGATVSQVRLAAEIGVSKRWVRTCLQELERQGWVQRVRIRGLDYARYGYNLILARRLIEGMKEAFDWTDDEYRRAVATLFRESGRPVGDVLGGLEGEPQFPSVSTGTGNEGELGDNEGELSDIEGELAPLTKGKKKREEGGPPSASHPTAPAFGPPVAATHGGRHSPGNPEDVACRQCAQARRTSQAVRPPNTVSDLIGPTTLADILNEVYCDECGFGEGHAWHKNKCTSGALRAAPERTDQ